MNSMPKLIVRFYFYQFIHQFNAESNDELDQGLRYHKKIEAKDSHMES